MNTSREIRAICQDYSGILPRQQIAGILALVAEAEARAESPQVLDRFLSYVLKIVRLRSFSEIRFETQQDRDRALPIDVYWNAQLDHYAGLDKRAVWFSSVSGQQIGSGEPFGWLSALEGSYANIHTELLALRGRNAFKNYDEPSPEHVKAKALTGTWATLNLYHSGELFEEHCRLCPQTVAVLRPIPGTFTPGNIAQFSAMSPGTHVRRHRGIADYKLRVQLCLENEPGCEIEVDSARLHWQTGRTLIFDDTYDHEVWNTGASSRIVLLFDIWHPQLAPSEQVLLQKFSDLSAASNGMMSHWRATQRNLQKLDDGSWWR
jgi:aspartate beta-hydroxylase